MTTLICFGYIVLGVCFLFNNHVKDRIIDKLSRRISSLEVNQTTMEIQSHSHSDQIKDLSSKLDRLIDYLNLEEESKYSMVHDISKKEFLWDCYEDVPDNVSKYVSDYAMYNHYKKLPELNIKKYFTPKSGGKKK